MGQLLEKPNTNKDSKCGNNSSFNWASCEMQGWRESQEDTHIIYEIDLPNGKKAYLFGVFDGHGGKEASEFA